MGGQLGECTPVSVSSPDKFVGIVIGVRLGIFFYNSGNGRHDFFYDDDDDNNEFRAVNRFFPSISGSIHKPNQNASAQDTTKTAGTTKPSWKPGCANDKAFP